MVGLPIRAHGASGVAVRGVSAIVRSGDSSSGSAARHGAIDQRARRPAVGKEIGRLQRPIGRLPGHLLLTADCQQQTIRRHTGRSRERSRRLLAIPPGVHCGTSDTSRGLSPSGTGSSPCDRSADRPPRCTERSGRAWPGRNAARGTADDTASANRTGPADRRRPSATRTGWSARTSPE